MELARIVTGSGSERELALSGFLLPRGAAEITRAYSNHGSLYASDLQSETP